MRTRSKIEEEYWEDLECLKSGTTKFVDTKSTRFKFTKDAVGREAGRGKGYVRYESYPITVRSHRRCSSTVKHSSKANGEC